MGDTLTEELTSNYSVRINMRLTMAVPAAIYGGDTAGVGFV